MKKLFSNILNNMKKTSNRHYLDIEDIFVKISNDIIGDVEQQLEENIDEMTSERETLTTQKNNINDQIAEGDLDPEELNFANQILTDLGITELNDNDFKDEISNINTDIYETEILKNKLPKDISDESIEPQEIPPYPIKPRSYSTVV